MALLTTTIGSLPKPVALRRARWKFAEGEVDRTALDQATTEATQAALALQHRLGFDVLTDGQMDRGDMVSHFVEKLASSEPGGLVRCWGNRYYRRPRIVGPVAREQPLIVDTWRAHQALVSDGDEPTKPVKAILTGPYTLMDWSFDEHYPSREACCTALAKSLAEEVQALLDAGASEIQIDEPAISGRADELGWIRDALEMLVDGVSGRARIWLHLCYGDLQPVLGSVLDLPADVILLELANSRFELVPALDQLPDSKMLGAGMVDVVRPATDSAADLRPALESVLERVPAQRLWLTPDAGLRGLTAAIAEAKLQTVMDLAKTVSG